MLRPSVRARLHGRRSHSLALGAALLVTGSSLAACQPIVPGVVPPGDTGSSTTQTVFGTAAPSQAATADTNAVEVGVRIRPDVNGTINGVRFYKGSGNTGPHTGTLWSAGGAQLATATFAAETASGWQSVSFATPVAVTAGTTYVASYHTDTGHYAGDNGYFTGRTAGTGAVHALADTATAGNGLFAYGGHGFPAYSYKASNYWVDVTFTPSSTTSTSSAPTTTAKPSTTTAAPTTTTKPTTTTAAPTTTTTKPPTTTTTAAPPPPTTTGFPGPSNTGVPAGTALSASGSFTVSTPGAVVDAKDVAGTITVAAPNVVIKRSRFTGSGQSYAINVASGASVTVQDSEVTGNYTGAAVAFDNWTLIRCNLHGLPDDGVKLGNNVRLQDSWLHDWATAPGAHADGGQIQNGVTNVNVVHNTIDIVGGNAALFMAPDLGPSSSGPVNIQNNLLGGGGYTVFNVDGNNGQYVISNISITGNRFKRNATWGPVRNNVPVTWSANVWDDTGAALPLA